MLGEQRVRRLSRVSVVFVNAGHVEPLGDDETLDLAGILNGFRWCLVGAPGLSWTMFAIAGPLTIVLLLVALVSFRRVERTLPDYL